MLLFDARDDKSDVALAKWTVHSLSLLHLCVLSSAQSPRERLITFGERIKIETMPHSVMILLDLEWPNITGYFSGSLINHRWVLSSAHTFEELFKSHHENANIKIRFGIDHMTQEGPVRDVKRVVCHRRYKEGKLGNDICLVQTFDEIPFSDRVQPALMPLDSETSHSVTHVRVAGWGETEETSYPWHLSAVDLPMMGHAECDRHLFSDLSWEEPDSFFCAGKVERDAKSPCYGDSGSAAVIRRDNKSWVALGVTCMGRGCDGPTLFTSVSYYVGWIKKTLNKYS